MKKKMPQQLSKDDEISKYCICENHKWTGNFNSRFIINEHFNIERV